MKHTPIHIALAITILVSGCTKTDPNRLQDPLLQATSWYQHSAEMKALCYQAYHWAGRELVLRISEGSEKPLAVVLDIDETVLDNSPQTAQQIVDREPYTDEMWDEWCLLARAEPLPGALEFTREASNLGIEVFYISNRRIHLLDVTLQNLMEAGFPNADSGHVLLKTDTSVKDARREKVRETHEIALLVGDNLGDFSGIFDDRNGGRAVQQVWENRDRFGTRFILLPNPMYGGWEKPFRGETPEATVQLKKEALKPYKR